jgi:hypothetical protein
MKRDKSSFIEIKFVYTVSNTRKSLK